MQPHRRRPLVWIAFGCLLLTPVAQAQDATGTADELTLELIMSDPDWLGRQPQRPFWADDSGAIYFLQKREGSRLNDLFRVDLPESMPDVLVPAAQRVEHEDMGDIDVGGGDLSTDGRKVYEREGDLYLKDLERGEIRQLTRTAARESSPRFLLGDRQITFTRGDTVLVRDLTTGLEYQPADLRLADDPDDEEKEDEDDYLADQQERLFEIVRLNEGREDAREDEDRAEQEADLTRPPLPFYLGEKLEVQQASLSPDGRLMLVVLNKEEIDRGKRDSMPNYVTASGYVENREVRSKVGTGEPSTDQLILLDLQTHERHDLDLSVLPEIADDPLAEVRAANKVEEEEDASPDSDSADEEATDEESADQEEEADKTEEDPEPRPVSIWNIEWTDNSSQVAFQAHSADNKDRWIATVDLETREVVPQHHLRDSAWINWRYNDFGWLPDGATLWYLSEETGYSHLYLRTPGQQQRALTSGEYEVSSPHVTREGDAIFYVANDLHPGRYEVHRFNLRNGESERLTDLDGMNRFVLSPDEQTLLLTHSTTNQPVDLWIQPAAAGAEARQITSSVSQEFLARTWIAPEIVPIPSSHHDRPVYARVYDAVGPTPLDGSDKRPAVVFIHGAGYLQNSHMGWSGYFREYMFHNLLARRGYVVLDMDYRASAGYGRDWRTAIYRQMGWPEVEDLRDGVDWLVANEQRRPGTPHRRLRRLLRRLPDLHGDVQREPDLFAAGAALRPVTDWAHYNHGYTSNILNTPVGRPRSPTRRAPPSSSPRGSSKPLLICPRDARRQRVLQGHGAPRVQRLIELEKTDWEVAMYPDRAARLPRAVELARRIPPHLRTVPSAPGGFRMMPISRPSYLAKR